MTQNNKVKKSPLNFDKYAGYEIPQEYMAYQIILTDITEQEGENLEYDYSFQGYKIFYSELRRTTANLFELTLVIAKNEVSF